MREIKKTEDFKKGIEHKSENGSSQNKDDGLSTSSEEE